MDKSPRSKLRSIETYRATLRLTKQEADTYELLLACGPVPATHISHALNYSTNAVYRLAKQLTARRFVIVRQGWPRLFEAVPLRIALEQVARTSQAEQAVVQANLLGMGLGATKANTAHGTPPDVEILNGREELYDRYAVEAQQAQHEILVFAIGIAYSDHLDTVQREVRHKNVEVRHIVQKYTKDNYYILQKWLRIGVKLRHYPTPLGFHLMVFDGRKVIISFSNPVDTDTRTSLIVQAPAAASAMREYFFNMWAKSQLIR